jgi:hypothetical protein
MRRAFLFPLAIFGVFLLAGCSGSGASAQCKAAEDAYAEYKADADKRQKDSDELRDVARKSAVDQLSKCQSDPTYRARNEVPANMDCGEWAGEFLMKSNYYEPEKIYRLANKVIDNNPECFTPQQVAEAQENLQQSLQLTITTE